MKAGQMEVRIVRSEKRRKTVQARRVNGILEILAPAHISDEQLQPHIEKLRMRLDQRERLGELDDTDLERRALELNQLYFSGALKWESIRWVSNQERRHGSCTPERGTIRISHRVARMPNFVQDYILVHELAHLLEPNHGESFWKLVARYPRAERARGYLMACGLEQVEE
jgi:predicted metal-dependent hydrolase